MIRRTHTASELAQWRAWEKLHGPLGAKRLDWLAGWIAFHVAAAAGVSVELEKMIPWLDRGSARSRLRKKWKQAEALYGDHR